MKLAIVAVDDSDINSIKKDDSVTGKFLAWTEDQGDAGCSDTFPGDIPEIKMVLTDCDGCLTDGGMYYSENGDEMKKFNTKDGMAFKLLREHGIITGIITGENVTLNKRRAEKLKLDVYEPGCTDKAECIKRICAEKDIDIKNVLYVGDDINDRDVLALVGYGCAPSDAVDEVKVVAKYITRAKGGEGVIREITDKIILSGR